MASEFTVAQQFSQREQLVFHYGSNSTPNFGSFENGRKGLGTIRTRPYVSFPGLSRNCQEPTKSSKSATIERQKEKERDL
jgi:hypothetical protein